MFLSIKGKYLFCLLSSDFLILLYFSTLASFCLSFTSLLIAGGFLVLLIAMNKMGVRNLLIYTLVGVGLWLAFLKSGVHATVAGVLLAFTIPVSSRINTKKFKNETESLLKDFDNAGEHGDNVLTNSDRLSIIDQIENNCEKILTPLQRFEHGLHPWVSFFIMPVFALANAGVTIGSGLTSALTHPVSIGIILGLFLGKQIGIFSFSYLAVKLKLASEPEGVSWKKIYAASVLAGIGFTMSLFIANLAFNSPELLNISKVGILAGSLLSGIIGFIILKSALRKT